MHNPMLKEIKYSGYSTTPSDYEAPDGELATAVNVIPENAALHPVLPPKTEFTIPAGYKLMYVHDTYQFTHYIIYCTNSSDTTNYGKLRFVDAGDGTTPITIDLTDNNNIIEDFQNTSLQTLDAIGNTLLALTTSGMYYILWKNGKYKNLGNHLPECDMQFFLLKDSTTYETDEYTIADTVTASSMEDYMEAADNERKDQVAQYVMAAANKAIALVHEENKFCFPFFVRTAYRLFDGSLTMQSAPILMIPWIDSTNQSNNPRVSIEGHYLTIYDVPDTNTIASVTFKGEANGFGLNCHRVSAQQLSTLKDWSDIITSIDVFVSQQFYTYNQGAPNKKVQYSYTSEPLEMVPTLPTKNYIDEIKFNHTFYYIKSLFTNEISEDAESIDIDFQPTNENIVVREALPDDYDSHDMLIPTESYSLNSRVNLYDLKKRLFDGYAPKCLFSSPEYATAKSTKFLVVIEDENDIVVQSAQMNVNYNSNDLIPWFYYPNINAKEMYAFVGDTVRKFTLKRHDNLMGAYYLGYTSNADADTAETTPTVSTDDQKTISLQNKIYTSEVNNPYYFPALGVNTVSTGKILGLCAAVKALSQGQFGQFPMYAFTTEGVWAMEVTSTGTYSAKQPVTRDVCTNPDSITSLDTSVLFATDRGIMMLSGSNSICITDVLNDEQNKFAITQLITAQNITTLSTGTAAALKPAALAFDAVTYIPFQTFIKTCRIIYDYVHQRIIVYNPSTSYNYAYMFSLESKKWGMITTTITDNINSYPEAIAIEPGTQGDKAVNMSVYDEGTTLAPTIVNALVMTRPLKFDMPDVLKTVDTVIQRGRFQKGHVKCALFGSRDLLNWHLVYSSTDHYLRGFRGTPYKYFRVALFAQLLKDESIYGCSVQLTPRGDNQPR